MNWPFCGYLFLSIFVSLITIGDVLRDSFWCLINFPLSLTFAVWAGQELSKKELKNEQTSISNE